MRQKKTQDSIKATLRVSHAYTQEDNVCEPPRATFRHGAHGSPGGQAPQEPQKLLVHWDPTVRMPIRLRTCLTLRGVVAGRSRLSSGGFCPELSDGRGWRIFVLDNGTCESVSAGCVEYGSPSRRNDLSFMVYHWKSAVGTATDRGAMLL